MRLRPALLAALLAPAAAWAQPVDRSQLPSLTPAVFESRGTVAVTLPQVDRQPLSGFGPLPRRFQVAADRAPTVLPFAPDPDALPALALAPPTAPAQTDLVVRRLRAEGGPGTQASAYGRLDLTASGAGGEFFVDADYDAVDATGPTAGLDVPGFETIALRAGGQSYGPGRISIEGHVERETYPSGFDERVRQSAGGTAGLEGVGATPFRVRLGFETGSFDVGNGSETSESRVDAAARIARGWLSADAAGGISGSGDIGSDRRYGAAGLAVSLGREDGARARFGARVLGYESDGQAGIGSATGIGPILDLALPLSPTVSAFVVNNPHVAPRSLADLTSLSPYLAPDPVVVPDIVPVDGRAGLAMAVGGARARVFALALRAPTYLAFETFGIDPGDPLNAGQGLDVQEVYLDVSAFGLGGDIALTSESGVSASASLAIRSGRTDDGGDIPYWSPLVATAGLQVPFSQGRGRVGLAAHIEGSRPTDRAATFDAPAFALLSAEASYAVFGPFAVVARAERLAGVAEEWPIAVQRPRTFLIGLRLQR